MAFMSRVPCVFLLMTVFGCDERTIPATGDAGGLADSGAFYVGKAVRACAIASGCRPSTMPDVNSGAAYCIGRFEALFTPPASDLFGTAYYRPDIEVANRLLVCADKHDGSDCNAFHACFGGNWVDLSICRPEATCQGTRIVHRSDPALYMDCASLGADCIKPSQPQLPMDVGVCCARKSCETVCESSTKGTSCSDGVAVTFDCAPFNMLCSTDPKHACVGNQACPATPLTGSCESATVARYCQYDKLVKYDCQKYPFATACKSNTTPPCWGAGEQCTSSDDETCHGDKMVVCVDGFQHEVDCKALGFARCAATGDAGTNGRAGCSN